MDINVNTLIKEVHKHQVLWDLSHKDHNNRFLLEKLWTEVATIVNVGPREARQKWKYLRDQHRREIKKVAESSAEGFTTYEPTWKYFQPLSFLNGQISTKSEKSNFAPEHVEIPNGLVKTDFWEEEETNVFESTMESSSSSSRDIQRDDNEEKCRKRRKTKMDVDEDLLAYLVKLEKKKVDLLLAQDEEKKKEKTDDFYFMSSLLPIMKTFTDLQKLKVRKKILQVIIDEMNGDSNVPESSA